jgi:hypothetical protein
MEDATNQVAGVDETPELAAAFRELLAELEQSRARMRADQEVIGRLKAETRALQAETVAMLASLKKAA